MDSLIVLSLSDLFILEQKYKTQNDTVLAYVVSGRIRDFDPSSLPGGVLTGIHVHKTPDCVQLGACNDAIPSQGLVVANDALDDPVEEIEWSQNLNRQATEAVSSGENRLKRIMKALKYSAEMQRLVEEKISKMRDSNALLKKQVESEIGK